MLPAEVGEGFKGHIGADRHGDLRIAGLEVGVDFVSDRPQLAFAILPPSSLRQWTVPPVGAQIGSALVVLTSSITVYVRVSRTPGRLQITEAIISR